MPNSHQIHVKFMRILCIHALEMQQELAPKIGSRRSPRTLLIHSIALARNIWCSPVATSPTLHGYIKRREHRLRSYPVDEYYSPSSTALSLSPATALTRSHRFPTNPPPTLDHGARSDTTPAVGRADRGGAALAFAVDDARGGAARGGATLGGGGGGGAWAGRGDERGVPQLAAQHVGLPAVRAGREQGAGAGQAVLPGAGGDGGLQPRLPLRAPLRGRRLLRHRRRLRPRARAPRRLPRRHPAPQHLRSTRLQCSSGPISGAGAGISLAHVARRQPTVPCWSFAVRLAAGVAQAQPRRAPPPRRRRPRRLLRRRDGVLLGGQGQPARLLVVG